MTKAEVKKLDTLVSRKVRGREGHCVFCKRPGEIYHPHHLVSRRYRAVRWEPDNVQKICHRCHYRATNDPLWNDAMSVQVIGQERYDELKLMAQTVKAVNDYELVKLLWRGNGQP